MQVCFEKGSISQNQAAQMSVSHVLGFHLKQNFVPQFRQPRGQRLLCGNDFCDVDFVGEELTFLSGPRLILWHSEY